MAVLGDLHIDPRDMDDTYEAREHVKTALAKEAGIKFLVSLGDVGESKDCTNSKQLYSGTSECFAFVREYLDDFGYPFDIIGGNHDLG